MKRIRLLIGNDLFTDGEKVFCGKNVFFDSEIAPEIKRFSLVVLYARAFKLENCRKIVDLYSFPQITDTVFIVGDEKEKCQLKNKLSFQAFTLIKVGINQNPSAGVFYSSLKMGLRGVSRRSDFIILQFGTMAELEEGTVLRLMEGAMQSGKDIIIPVWKGQRGHPIIFSNRLLPILFSLRKEKGLPFLLKHYQGSIAEIPVHDENIIKQ